MSSETLENFADNFSEIDLHLHGVRLPTFEIGKESKRKLKISEDAPNEAFLFSLCQARIKELNLTNDKQYTDRFSHEFDIIKELGFVDYILLVWDVLNFCKEENIPVGLGRGSAAGSLILYLIDVTKMDPIKNGLFFERFISKIRAKKQVVDGITYLDGGLMPDIDIDVCYYNRQKVLTYLNDKFAGKTSKILTFNTLSSKLLIKECGKIVSNKSEVEMNEVSGLIPKQFGLVKGLDEAWNEVENFKLWCEENKRIYQIALKLRGLIKNKGVHPSAMSLSFGLTSESYPVELSSDKESLVSSYDADWMSIFNVKLDVLGLRAVSVVHDVCENIGARIVDIDVHSEIIYQNLQNLKTPHGLFQIEAETNFKVCQKVKPKGLKELSSVLALGRPGALAFVDQYENYTNNGVYDVIHPFFNDILEETGGVALYQEQLMKMANKVGFTLDEAEILRRIVGKKKKAEAKEWKKKIENKIKENKLDSEIGDILWKVLEDSANYSFNKSHSISYAALSAITIYLKFTHPQQFYLSLLKMTRHEPDPINEISKIHKEMDLFGIKLLPPHLIKSQMNFSIEGNDIRFGLLSVKGISDKSIEKLIAFKNEYSTKFEVFEAAGQSGLGIGILCALIQAGAFEGFKQSRTKVVYEAQLWNILTVKEKTKVMTLGERFDFDLVAILKHLIETKDEKGKSIFKDSRWETIQKKSEPYKQIFNQNKKSETFANWYYEKQLLGYTYNSTLKNIFSSKGQSLTSIREIDKIPIKNEVTFVGVVEEVWSGVSREKKTKYFKCLISDETGTIKTMIFSDKMELCASLNLGLPKEKNIVVVKGRKFEEVVFADLISVQDNIVYTKLSELKKQD